MPDHTDNRGRLLLIDDEVAVRETLPILLALRGWTVQAACPDEGVSLCVHTTPDALVVDYRMPRLSGLDVAERVRCEGYNGPIVLYSSYLTSEICDAAAAVGVHPHDKADPTGLIDLLDRIVCVDG